jgi:hypothetical protein
VTSAFRTIRRRRDCDVVWTRTEYPTLSVLLLRKWHGGVPVGDAPSLKATLAEMASDPDSLVQQVVAARARMAAAVGADKFVRRYVELSRELLDARS